jgi:hypothetical protein
MLLKGKTTSRQNKHHHLSSFTSLAQLTAHARAEISRLALSTRLAAAASPSGLPSCQNIKNQDEEEVLNPFILLAVGCTFNCAWRCSFTIDKARCNTK